MAVSIVQTANPAGVSASSNVATYSGVSIGTASPDRKIVVAVASELASTPINSCTIDGNAMTAGDQGNQGAVYARLFYLPYPTGTTADIAVTFGTNSPSNTKNHIAVYKVTDAVYSSKGADQSTDMDSTDPLTTGSTTIASGGGMIAVAGGATNGTGKTWSNLSEDIDADAGALRFTTAYSTTAGTATRTCTGGTNGEDGALSWIIFADNSSPTVALSSPADSATGVSTTPDLTFTGTDADSDDVRYEVQVHTTNTFHQPTFRTATQNSSSTGTAISISAPSGTATGDLVKVIVEANGQTTIVDNNGSTPFTEQIDDYKPNTSEGHTVSVFSRVIQDGDPSTYNFTSGASGRWGVIAICITGVSTPVDDVAPSTTNATNRDSFPDGNSTSASITTGVDGAAHIVVHCWDTSAIGTISTPSGYTLLANANGGGEPIHASYKIITTAGATGTTVANNTEVSSYIALSFSVKLNTLIDKVSGTDAGFSGTINGNGVSITNIVASDNATPGTSFTTSSISPVANRLDLLTVSARNNSSTQPVAPTVTGAGLTWVSLGVASDYDTTTTSMRSMFMFGARGSSPSSGALTVDFGATSHTGIIYNIDEFTGIDGSGTNGSGAVVQVVSNADSSSSASSITGTLSAFGSSQNATYAVFCNGTNALTATAGTGFAKVGEYQATDSNTAGRMVSEFKSTNDTTADLTYSSTCQLGVIAVEIKAGDPFQSGTSTTYTVQSALSNSTTYYWRVRAKDPSGSNSYGAWSSTRSFTTTSGATATDKFFNFFPLGR